MKVRFLKLDKRTGKKLDEVREVVKNSETLSGAIRGRSFCWDLKDLECVKDGPIAKSLITLDFNSSFSSLI